ncbi:uncharacterized protein LOC122300119 isoform X2 [Carya illinoinensis]|uniref:uncharacterized protein LOC122300119 isoform X2 n=1 Tax=Carya illinoinensis TaxID=32201 RepID=UPI001C71E5DF|nr:uncharacterized protein LOC122300119 isoform X2 [Carya illinoinensis]
MQSSPNTPSPTLRLGRRRTSAMLILRGSLILTCRITDPGDKIHTSIDWGLWGWKCKSSMIAKENCALQCLALPCYELIYASDPLEEGEKDLVRSQEFKYCMHKLSLGESLEGIKGSFEY